MNREIIHFMANIKKVVLEDFSMDPTITDDFLAQFHSVEHLAFTVSFRFRIIRLR